MFPEHPVRRVRIGCWLVVECLVVALGLSGSQQELSAHKPFKSSYTFHEHIRPIFLAKCASCHIEGGIAPMSLLDYKSAYPWAESIKSHLVGQTMPPWQAEADFSPLKHETSLSAAELDTILDWASGQTPEGQPRELLQQGDSNKASSDPPAADQLLMAPEPFVLGAETNAARRWFVFPRPTEEELHLSAIEIRPGLRSIVRSVTLYWDETEISLQKERADTLPGFSLKETSEYHGRMLLRWVAGQETVTLPEDVAYHVPANATVVAEITYAKTWLTQGSEVSDQTAVGFFESRKTPRHRIRSTILRFTADGNDWQASVPETMQILNLMPLASHSLARWQLDRLDHLEKRSDGIAEPLLLLHQWTHEWNSQYWFRDPVALTKGEFLRIAAETRDSNELAPDDLSLELQVQHVVPIVGQSELFP